MMLSAIQKPWMPPSAFRSGWARHRIVIPLVAAAVAMPSAGTEDPRIGPLLAGDPVVLGPIEGTDDGIRFRLEANRYLHIEASSRDIDATLRLIGEDGEDLASIDLSHRFDTPEHLIAVVEDAGHYRLAATTEGVAAEDVAARDGLGGVEVTLKVARPATDTDRVRVRAERRYLEAWTLGRDRGASAQSRAAERYRLAIEDFVIIDDAEGEAKSRHNLASILRRQRDLESARRQLELAIPRWQVAENLSGLVDSHVTLSSVLRSANELERARDTLLAALPVAERIGDPGRLSRVWNNLGRIHRARDEIEEALSAYQASLHLRRDMGDARALATTLNNLGILHRAAGRYHRALLTLDEAARIASEHGLTTFEATVRNNLGTIANALGDRERSLLDLGRALELVRAQGDRAAEARTLNNIGWSHQQAAEYGPARESFERALAIHRELGDRGAEATTLENLARNEMHVGRLEPARKLLHRALALHRALKTQRGEAKTLAELAIVLEASDPQAARTHAERARLLATATHDPRTLLTAHVALARIARRGGELERARRRAETAVETLEVLRTDAGDATWRASLLASKHDVYELLVDVLLRLDAAEPGTGWAFRAFEVAEQAKARSLRDTLRAASVAPADVDPALVAAEARLRRQVRGLALRRDRSTDSDAGTVSGTGAGTDSGLGRRLDEAIADHRLATARLAAAAPDFARLTEPARFDATRIRTLLGSRTVLFEFLLGETSSALFVVDDRGVRAFRLPPRAEIEDQARSLIEALGARGTAPGPGETLRARRARIERADAEARSLARALGRVLLAPAAGALDQRRLVVVPDGLLAYLPFAAIAHPQTGAPLIVDREIVFLPSLDALAALRDAPERPVAVHHLAVVADPVTDRHDPRLVSSEMGDDRTGPAVARLSGTAAEAQALRDANATTLVGFAANRDAILDGALSGHRRVHFATHGVLDGRYPELSALTLSSYDPSGGTIDGFLRLGDIYRLQLDAELVVLSACESALGRSVRGEGLIGLARGFLFAGARHVVASLWRVRDDTTARLMARFDRRLREGDSAPAALRGAQLAMRADPSTAAPYFWAGFTGLGAWE